MRTQLFSLSAGLILTQCSYILAAQIPMLPESHTEGYKFDPLLHLPGISPYFDAVGFGLSHSAPRNCEVTAASYLVRHAAIYANDDDYERYMEPFIAKLNSTLSPSYFSKKARKGWAGPLAFFNKWENPINDPKKQLEQITPQGILDSKEVARHLLSRYPKLVPTTQRIYADKKARTQDTAQAFAAAFPQVVSVVDIHLNRSSFASQDPHKACRKFSKGPGNDELDAFMHAYTPAVIERLRPFAPVNLTATDIMGLQQMCGYESAIRGVRSRICRIFTDVEWMAYEYAWDLKYSLMVGHGNPLSPYLGFPWLNVTAQLMSKFHEPSHVSSVSGSSVEGGSGSGSGGGGDSDGNVPDDDGQRFFLAFTHREVPPFIATALGLFNSSNAHAEEFPTDRINWSRAWRMAELIPFLGHVGIEKLTCERGSGEGEFIRVIANSAPRPIPGCQGGPGASCEVDRFGELVKAGMRVYGDFDGVCENDVDADGVGSGDEVKVEL